jgi:hypothetical protein
VKARRKTQTLLGALIAFAAWSVPAWALACPVCFSAKDEANRVAFFVSTMFMTALPLVLLGAFIAWVARRARALEAEERAERMAAAGQSPPAAVLPLSRSQPG